MMVWVRRGGHDRGTSMTESEVLTTPVTPHWTGIVANVVALAPADVGAPCTLVYVGLGRMVAL